MEAEQTQNTQAGLQQPNVSEGQPLDPKPKQDNISSKMEILLRRERAAVDAETRAKAKEAEIEARYAKLTEFESIKKDKPLDALKLLDIDYNDLSQVVLNDGNVPAEVLVKRLEDKIKNLEESLTQKEQSRAEEAKASAQKQADQAVNNFKKQITQYLEGNKDKYELMHFEGVDSSRLYQMIEDHWNETVDENGMGKIMPIEEAAQLLEKQLEEKYIKARDIPKFNSLFQATKGSAGQQMIKQMQEQQKASGLKTLTNNQAPSPERKSLTDEDRIKNAINMAKSKGWAR